MANLNKDLENIIEERTLELNETVRNLNIEILKRSAVESQLNSTLEMKQMLLNEITHRVKNSLQVISSLLNIQKITVSSKEAVELCEVTANRIHSMALIHQVLYKAGDFSQLDFDTYVNLLLEYLSDVFDISNIDIITDIDDAILSIDSSSSCGMLVLELLTNSFKYAFVEKKDDCKIHIALKKIVVGEFKLTVKDNGRGIPEYVDLENSDTLGIQLVYSLVEQLDGELKIINNGGVTFEITFKDRIRELI